MMTALTDRDQTMLAFLKERRDDLFHFLHRLVATPSPNPPGDVRAVIQVIREELAKLGLPTGDIVARTDERANLICRLPGRRGNPTLMLSGHLDTKPVGNSTQWRTNPLVPITIDGNLYGLGATDMKGGLAAIVYAAAALRHAGEHAGDLVLVFVSDEEAGPGHGARFLVDSGQLPKADACLIAEPNGIHGSEFEFLPLFCRGSFYFKIKVRGTQTHASISDQIPTVNASVKMAWVLWRMKRDLRLTYKPHPLCPQGPTITPGVMVNGGVYFGVHPGYAEFATDIRLVPGMTHEQVRADIEAFLAGLKQEDHELDAEIEVVGGAIQAELTGSEPFVQALLDASERILGRRPPFGAYPGFTDAYHIHQRAGIPTVPGYGPGQLTLAHSPNESVSIQGVFQAAQIYALAAAHFLS